MTLTMPDVRAANRNWFSAKNKRWFNDVSYHLRTGGKSGMKFLVRWTAGWTDMFDGIKKYHWVLNPVDPETLGIGTLVEEKPGLPKQFWTKDSLDTWLKEN